ncbi:AMIN-like domain-containing (lipo)protein [Streptomyces bobili]|uniref:AMIN-like domain-containing (lipo)protein n=1 Tax=Streptomyces bobili TaxID=67280 RepID=UPI002B1E0572|nr:hypothetical protein [Streptomyces bobili]
MQYLDRFYAAPSGEHIPVAGGAILAIRVGAWSNDREAGPTYPRKVGEFLPGVNISGYSTFKDTRFGGAFEGHPQIGIGVRARLPFGVVQLDDRVVIDVPHSWTSWKITENVGASGAGPAGRVRGRSCSGPGMAGPDVAQRPGVLRRRARATNPGREDRPHCGHVPGVRQRARVTSTIVSEQPSRPR